MNSWQNNDFIVCIYIYMYTYSMILYHIYVYMHIISIVYICEETRIIENYQISRFHKMAKQTLPLSGVVFVKKYHC